MSEIQLEAGDMLEGEVGREIEFGMDCVDAHIRSTWQC